VLPRGPNPSPALLPSRPGAKNTGSRLDRDSFPPARSLLTSRLVAYPPRGPSRIPPRCTPANAPPTAHAFAPCTPLQIHGRPCSEGRPASGGCSLTPRYKQSVGPPYPHLQQVSSRLVPCSEKEQTRWSSASLPASSFQCYILHPSITSLAAGSRWSRSARASQQWIGIAHCPCGDRNINKITRRGLSQPQPGEAFNREGGGPEDAPRTVGGGRGI